MRAPEPHPFAELVEDGDAELVEASLFDDPRGLSPPAVCESRKDRVGFLAETGLVQNAAICRHGVRRHLQRQGRTVASDDERDENRRCVALRSCGAARERRTNDPIEVDRRAERVRRETVRDLAGHGRHDGVHTGDVDRDRRPGVIGAR